MDIEPKNFEKELETLIVRLRDEFLSVRTNRPTTKLVDDLRVKYYDGEVPLKSIGTTSIVLPRDIVITVWDPNALQGTIRAVDGAGIGTANVEGNAIRITLPVLTDERKADLIKLVKKTSEDYRIRVRQMRDDIIKKVRSAEGKNEISENELFQFKEQVQKAVDKTNASIEKMLVDKIKEITE